MGKPSDKHIVDEVESGDKVINTSGEKVVKTSVEKVVKTPVEPVIGWKPFINVEKASDEATKSTNENRADKSWEQEMSDLKSKMLAVQTEFNSEVAKLRKDLEEERRARLKLETEVQTLRRLINK